jgi:PAS domain-containing protein
MLRGGRCRNSCAGCSRPTASCRTDPVAQTAFNDSQDSVRSIALLHEQLYGRTRSRRETSPPTPKHVALRRRQALSRGGDDPYGYLLEPFNDRELRTAVAVAVEKHELESRLATRERWFSTTLRSIGDAVIATDSNQLILFMNEVAERLTGWGPEAIGRPIAGVFRVVDRTGAPIASPLTKTLETSCAVQVPSDTGLVMKHEAAVATAMARMPRGLHDITIFPSAREALGKIAARKFTTFSSATR